MCDGPLRPADPKTTGWTEGQESRARLHGLGQVLTAGSASTATKRDQLP